MESTLTLERQHAHAFLDRLPQEQLTAVRCLLESMLSPLDRKLALAPLEDEPLSPSELASMEAGVASLDRNGGIPMQAVLADFGLSMDDFHQLTDSPDPQ
jgi:hypothetical protein